MDFSFQLPLIYLTFIITYIMIISMVYNIIFHTCKGATSMDVRSQLSTNRTQLLLLFYSMTVFLTLHALLYLRIHIYHYNIIIRLSIIDIHLYFIYGVLTHNKYPVSLFIFIINYNYHLIIDNMNLALYIYSVHFKHLFEESLGSKLTLMIYMYFRYIFQCSYVYIITIFTLFLSIHVVTIPYKLCPL